MLLHDFRIKPDRVRKLFRVRFLVEIGDILGQKSESQHNFPIDRSSLKLAEPGIRLRATRIRKLLAGVTVWRLPSQLCLSHVLCIHSLSSRVDSLPMIRQEQTHQ